MPAGSSAGGPRARRMQASCSMRWSRRYMIDGRSIVAGSCTTATGAAKADSSGRRNIDCIAHGSHSSSASAAVFQPSVFLGRALRAAATAVISSALWTLRSVPFGKY